MIRVLVPFLLGVAALSGQVVTETKLVSYQNKKELLRKINGRWWSQDNREVYPPGKGGFFWELDSKEGVVDFFHHTPAEVTRGESLHLFMTIAQVEGLLGKPNRIFRMGPDGGSWMYYGKSGTKLDVRIMEGVLGGAEYDAAGGKRTEVSSITQELGGQSIHHLMAQRATAKLAKEGGWKPAEMPPLPSREEHDRKIAELRRQRPSSNRVPSPRTTTTRSGSNAVLNTTPTAEPPKHIVSAEAVAAVKIGASKAEVLSALGEPSAKYSMASGDGIKETLRYHRPNGQAIEIKLVDGKVSVIPE